jgi:hypothetical protein
VLPRAAQLLNEAFANGEYVAERLILRYRSRIALERAGEFLKRFASFAEKLAHRKAELRGNLFLALTVHVAAQQNCVLAPPALGVCSIERTGIETIQRAQNRCAPLVVTACG